MPLELQHQQGAILSRMMLGIFRELSSIYSSGNPGMTFNDIYTAMAVYAEADTDAPEVTIPEIVAATGNSRTNVERITEALVSVGMIEKIAARRNVKFVSNPAFANHPGWQEQTKRIRDIILKAADELRDLWGITNLVLVTVLTALTQYSHWTSHVWD